METTRSAHVALALGLAVALGAGAAQEDGGPDPAGRVVERVNHYRSIAGAPPLAANAEVGTAAQSHAQYMADTRQLTHGEAQGTSPHFTADSLEDRLRKAGVHFKRSGEVVGLASQASPTTIVDDLMSTVYHRLLLLSSGFADAGAGVARAEEGGMQVVYVAIDMAGGATANQGDAAGVTVYPAPEQRDVPRDFDPATETPNPLPEHELVGLPVSVQADAERRLVVNHFRLTAEGQSTPVEAKVLTQTNDMEMPEWAAVLVPLQPLVPGANYEAEFDGTIAGRPAERRWRFTTAATRAVVMSFAQAVVPAGGTQTVRLRNVEAAAGPYYVCYEPVELVGATAQETFTRFKLRVNRCAPGSSCTVTVLAAHDKDCREPFARGSFQVGS